MQTTERNDASKLVARVLAAKPLIATAVFLLSSPIVILWYCLATGVPYADFTLELNTNLLPITIIIWVGLAWLTIFISIPAIILAWEKVKRPIESLLASYFGPSQIDRDGFWRIYPGFLLGQLILIAVLFYKLGPLTELYVFAFLTFIVLGVICTPVFMGETRRNKLNTRSEHVGRIISYIASNLFMIAYVFNIMRIILSYLKEASEEGKLTLFGGQDVAMYFLPISSFVVIAFTTFGFSRMNIAKFLASFSMIFLFITLVYPGPFVLVDNVFKLFRIGGGLPVVLFIEFDVGCLSPQHLRDQSLCRSPSEGKKFLETKPLPLLFLSDTYIYVLENGRKLRDGSPATIWRRDDVRVVQYGEKQAL